MYADGMTPFMAGFAGELVKLADDHHDHDVRKYVTSVLVGAAAAPLLALVGRGISRAVHNHDLGRMLKTVEPEKREALIREIHTGPVFGRHRPDLPHSQRPLITPGDVAGDVARAAVTGSAIQMVRDRYSKPRAKTDRA